MHGVWRVLVELGFAGVFGQGDLAVERVRMSVPMRGAAMPVHGGAVVQVQGVIPAVSVWLPVPGPPPAQRRGLLHQPRLDVLMMRLVVIRRVGALKRLAFVPDLFMIFYFKRAHPRDQLLKVPPQWSDLRGERGEVPRHVVAVF